MKILILVDCQNDFITGSLRNEDAIKAIPNIVNKIKTNEYDQIFVTRDTHKDDYLDTKEGEKLPVIHCVKDTEGWQIESSILEALKDRKFHYVDKPTFGSKELSFMIALTPDKNLDIDVVGFCTDICVVSNVLILKAAVYNRANITVDSSCCAGTSKEMHNEALNVMKSCQINII